MLVSSVAVALATCTAPSDHGEPSQSLEHLAKGPQTQAPILKATGWEGLGCKGVCPGKKMDSVSLSSHRTYMETWQAHPDETKESKTTF